MTTVQGYSSSSVCAGFSTRIAIQKNEAAWRVGMGWSPRQRKWKRPSAAMRRAGSRFVSKGTFRQCLYLQRSPCNGDEKLPKWLSLRSGMGGEGRLCTLGLMYFCMSDLVQEAPIHQMKRTVSPNALTNGYFSWIPEAQASEALLPAHPTQLSGPRRANLHSPP